MNPEPYSVLCVSAGPGARATGFMSVAVGRDAQAHGEDALCINTDLSLELPKDLGPALKELEFVKNMHQLVGNTASVRAIEMVQHVLLDELNRQYRRAREQQQTASAAAAPPLRASDAASAGSADERPSSPARADAR